MAYADCAFCLIVCIEFELLTIESSNNISDSPSHAMYCRSYFYFRYIFFHLSTWLPLFQIWPPTCIPSYIPQSFTVAIV